MFACIAGISKSVILYNANLNPNLELLWGDDRGRSQVLMAPADLDWHSPPRCGH